MYFDEKVTHSVQISTPRVVKRWLDTVFQGQYLPSLRINYGPINTNHEKLPPQLYQMKIKICYDRGCNDIRVVVATKRRYYLFYSQQYISAVGTGLPKSFAGAFSSISGFLQFLLKRISRTFYFSHKPSKTFLNCILTPLELLSC